MIENSLDIEKHISVIDWTFDQEELDSVYLSTLEEITHVVSTIPPDENTGLDPVLSSPSWTSIEKNNLKWIGYIGSTSVYGDHGGASVWEDSELLAEDTKGLGRICVEKAWLGLNKVEELPVHIFRCGGIYGPGRSLIETLKNPSKVAHASKSRRAAKKLIARCHVLDICNCIHASMISPNPGSVYNIVDDDPASRQEVSSFVKKLMGVEDTKANTAHEDLTRNAKGKRAGEKRVTNEKIKAQLGVQLTYPTYREGLAAIHAGDHRPFLWP